MSFGSARAVVLTSEAEVLERKEAGDVTVYAGVPETNPVSFVVNCPAPVLAANDFDPAEFAAGTPTAQGRSRSGGGRSVRRDE